MSVAGARRASSEAGGLSLCVWPRAGSLRVTFVTVQSAVQHAGPDRAGSAGIRAALQHAASAP